MEGNGKSKGGTSVSKGGGGAGGDRTVSASVSEEQSHLLSLSSLSSGHVSGQEFLTRLKTFVRRHVDDMEQGKLTLTLNASCIRFLNVVLKEIHEAIYGDTKSPKKNYFDEELLELHDGIVSLMCLKLEPTKKGTFETRGDIDLHMFKGLKWLEFNNVKPTLITNMKEISQQLEAIVVRGVLNSISEVLDFDADEKHPWPFLTELCCPYNNIPKIESMELLPKVVKVDLSHNLITKIENLAYCYNVDYLNLGFNSISSTANICEVLGNVKTLILRRNSLDQTTGLDKLFALEVLDLAENVIPSFEEIKRISTLPELTEIYFEGNPISFVSDYKTRVLQYFIPSLDTLILDGNKVTSAERDDILEKNTHNLKLEKLLAQEHKTEDVPIDQIAVPKKRTTAKKLVKKRVVDVMPAAKRSGEKQDAKPNTPQPVDDFRAKVEEMHAEGGDTWLVALKKFQEQLPPPPPIPEPVVKVETPTKQESVEKEQATTEVKNTPTQVGPVDSNTPTAESPVIQKNNPPKPITIADFSGKQEFSVERRNFEKGIYDERILLLSKTKMLEHDILSGDFIEEFSLKYFNSIQELQTEYGKPVIKLIFRIDEKEEALVYRLENPAAYKKLDTILRGILKSKGVRCVQCTTQYPSQTLATCPNCGSSMLVTYNQIELEEAAAAEAAAKAEEARKEAAKLLHDLSTPSDEPTVALPSREEIMEQTRKNLIKSTYFKFGESEQLLFELSTDLVLMRDTTMENASIDIILSNYCMYIKNAESDDLLAHHLVTDVKKVVAGLFFQYFWIEISETYCYLFITRDHSSTHQFLTILKSANQTVSAMNSQFWVANYNRDIITNISLQLFHSTQLVLHLYLLAFEKVKSLAGKPTPFIWQKNPKAPLAARTVIVTHEHILLCEEDITSSPGLHLYRKGLSQNGQYQVLQKHSISDINSVETDPQNPTSVTILFETEGGSIDNEPSKWELVTKGEAEAKKLVSTIARLWKDLYKLDLAIFEKGKMDEL